MTLALVPIFGVLRYFTLLPLNPNLTFQFMEGAWNWAVPLLLVGVVYIFYYRHRINGIQFKRNQDRAQDGLTMVSLFTGWIMLLLTGGYVEQRFGKLVELEFPSHLTMEPKANFYTIDSYEIPQNWGAMNSKWYTSGKYNSTLHFELLFASPFLNTTYEMLPEVPQVWYGVKFKDSMSNRKSDEEKEKYFEAFKEQCLKKMENWDFKQAFYFKNVPKSEDFFLYNQAIANRINVNSENQFIILEAVMEPFADRVKDKALWIFLTWLIGTAIFLLILVYGKPRKGFLENYPQLRSRYRTWQDEVWDKFSFWKNGPVSTAFLWILAILTFLMACSGVLGGYLDHPFLGDWGALRRVEVYHGDWYRLFSYGLLSTGPFLGLLNLGIFGYIAGEMEKKIGPLGFMLLSVSALFFGALVSLYVHPMYWVAGASPWVLGLISGYFLNGIDSKTLTITNLKPWILIAYVGLSFVLGFFDRMDHAANLGGLCGGFLGYYLFKSFQKRQDYPF